MVLLALLESAIRELDRFRAVGLFMSRSLFSVVGTRVRHMMSPLPEAGSNIRPVDANAQMADTDPWMLEMAVKEAEDYLCSLRELVSSIDSKCLQLLGLLVTAAGLLGGAAGAVVMAGGYPLYLSIAPAGGAFWMVRGIWTGLRALDGKTPIMGMKPSDWDEILGTDADRSKVLQGRLNTLRKSICKTEEISRKLSKRVDAMKSSAFYAVAGALLAVTVGILLDVTGYHPIADPFMPLPSIQVEKKS